MSAHTAPPPASRPSPALGQAATTPRGDGRVYLDYAASAPVRPQVAEQVAQDLGSGLGGWASPSAQHASGRRASALLSQARARVAQALGAGPHEVLFTSGGSEADSLAVIGRVMAARAAGVERPQVVISGVEHPAVADSARVAQSLGAELTVLGVDAAGRVDPARAASALDPGRTALVSVMTANNETGVVQDVAGIVSAVRQASPGARRGGPEWVPVHTDAVAAVAHLPVDFNAWDLDALSLSGHKLGAPVGVGVLVLRREVALTPAAGGGRQERGIRSGTQDVVGARALALALELAVAEREREAARLEKLRAHLLAGATALPGVRATLPVQAPHLPGTAHLTCQGADSEALLMDLDLAGIDASAGSACHAGVTQPSAVMLAMGHDEATARSTLRATMGRATTAQDVDRLLAALPHALEVARRASALRRGSAG
ncbi:MAG: cysteine desulfurase family protein [Actinomyces urogenitalis]|uniref:cysteine desulfurase n=3 Tax=Actinomyces urogenitalis TaxID=103621 RepID=C0W8Z0_9ACTO|nr:cysteine desulfurase family protein [Actinomyces urogenitalis]EEH64804.1 aminotransferase, class V [Actinomyces urogenitalis DSM 15434]MBS5977299.1 cysteine desulfurase [Actinomyces urogenitalis]MBS6072751.1 cysteine desulfurase [Actinomyces urogenitalis]MDK8835728.1 cysteine desulfurase family protein [Actinomyces urogenitalis]MDU0864158.1 cysteine desulfurase family protein [Actinomyces urogenitalis]